MARVLSTLCGVLEPLQGAATVDGQLGELKSVLDSHAATPVVLIGYSWGAWLGMLYASQWPESVKKLILIGCSPLTERDARRITETRLLRLDEEERRRTADMLTGLNDPSPRTQSACLSELGSLMAKADAYDPVPEAGEAQLPYQGDVFHRVWNEAVALRRSGELLDHARRIRCPVVAIHGDYDPHPYEAIERGFPLPATQFRFILLSRCGHTPWRERHARERFFALLREELSGT